MPSTQSTVSPHLPPGLPPVPATKQTSLFTCLKPLLLTLSPSPSPLLPLPMSPPPLSSSSPIPQTHELSPPLPLSITTASPSPPEYTEAKLNNCQTQAEAKTTSTSNGDANLIIKLEQAQVSYKTHNNCNNPDNSTKGKTADTNSKCSGNRRNHSNHLHNLNFSISNNSKFMYDLGGTTSDTEDGSACDNGDSTSSSSDSVPCNGDAYHSLTHDCDKSILTTSDINPFLSLKFMQVTCLVNAPHSVTNLLAIHLANLKHVDTAHCALPPQHSTHPLNFTHATFDNNTDISNSNNYNNSTNTSANDRNSNSNTVNNNNLISNSNSISDNNISFIDITCNFHTCIANSNLSSNSNNNNNPGLVDATCTFNTDDANSNSNSINNSNSHSAANIVDLDTEVYAPSTNAGSSSNLTSITSLYFNTILPIHTAPATTACDNKPDHECAHITPLNVSHNSLCLLRLGQTSQKNRLQPP